MKKQWVEYNGYQFSIMTYAHERLRNIQFYFIERDIVQACGRNRTIRENSTVYLFSNYPLPGFEQRKTKELPDADPDVNEALTIDLYSPSCMPTGSLG